MKPKHAMFAGSTQRYQLQLRIVTSESRRQRSGIVQALDASSPSANPLEQLFDILAEGGT